MRDDRWSSVLSAKPGFISHVQKSARTMSLKCTHVSCVETQNSLPANQIVSELRITSLQRSRVPRQLSRSANGARCVKGAWERESARCWQCYFYDNKLICVQRFHQIIFWFIVFKLYIDHSCVTFRVQILTTILSTSICFETGKEFF